MRRALSSSHRWAALVALVVGLVALATPALAQFDQYGHYNQNANEFAGICSGPDGSNACGPIALMNSLVFLQNTNPKLGNTLMGGNDPVATARKISEFMGCTACGGTDTTKFYDGKKRYLESVAPGKIVSKRYVKPTAANLKKEIDDREDVELFIGYYDQDGKSVGGHYVTLYALSDLKISFVDPGGVEGGSMTGATDESINYTFNDGIKQLLLTGYDGTPNGAQARIDFAFAESPAPEPATWAMMVLGFGLMGAGIRRRRTAWI